jgi:hypothetical protein
MSRRLAKGVVATASIVVLLAGIDAGAAWAAPTPAWRVISATGPTNLPSFTSEIQRLLVNAESGDYTLRFEGEETGPIGVGASAGDVSDALQGLAAIGEGNVEVSGGPGGVGAGRPYFVRFVGGLATTDVPTLSADSSGLIGGASSATIDTKAEGGTPGQATLVAYATNIGGATTSGPIKIEVGPLPDGITGSVVPFSNGRGWSCSPLGPAGQSILECETEEAVPSGETISPVEIPLAIGPAAPAESQVPVSVWGGGAGSIAEGLYRYVEPLTVSSAPAVPGLSAFWAGAFDADGFPSTQAGAHPAVAATGFLLNTVISPAGKVVPAADLRNVDVQLPPGFLGNPLATVRCPQTALLPTRGLECTSASTVGYAAADTGLFGQGFTAAAEGGSVFNDRPAPGYPAEFGFEVLLAPIRTLGMVRSESDYGVTIEAPDIVMAEYVYGNFFSLYGRPPGAPGAAFLTNPTSCSEEAQKAPATTISVNSWQDQDPRAVDGEMTVAIPPVTGCEQLGPRFNPAFTFQPASRAAESPTAATARLSIPQEGLEDPSGLAAPQLKKAVVDLPEGVTVNPSSAGGLEACSEAEIGLTTTNGEAPSRIRFDGSRPSCPDASILGAVEAKSPLLEEALAGTIYLARQGENPFGSLLTLYLVIDSPKNGILIKLPGEVVPDPRTGQLRAVFDDSPQLPVSSLTLSFRGGPRSPLATPALCGGYVTNGELTPWSAPESGPAAQTNDGFAITEGAGGGACATSEAGLPFAPRFDAGSASTAAGAFAPLVVKLERGDGEAELERLDFTLPPGLTAKLAGVPYCSEAAIAAARGKSGREEQGDPSCPATSRIGSVDTAAGVGTEPIHVAGSVYLAGPYEGAPLSAVVVTPAVAGPFDLGDVVVRAGLFVDPQNAQITARSDAIPHILRGVPLKLRSVAIKVDRAGFSLNPTSCDPMSVGAKVGATNGASASPSSRFQVGGCAALPFKPRLTLRVIGKTNRNAKPRLKAVLTTKPGEAGIRRAQVNLPHSEFLEQNHIKTVCTRVQFAEGDGNGSACPRGSVYGHARAWTPLLDHPLEGYVYLRSNGGERKLPDLVAALNGQIDIALRGKVDSGPNKGIRNTFEVVPDAPVSRFVLEMAGGRHGLLVNSEDLCARGAKRQAIVRLVGQNGKVSATRPSVGRRCGKARKAKGRGRRHRPTKR